MLCEAPWSNFKLIRRYINLLNLFNITLAKCPLLNAHFPPPPSADGAGCDPDRDGSQHRHVGDEHACRPRAVRRPRRLPASVRRRHRPRHVQLARRARPAAARVRHRYAPAPHRTATRFTTAGGAACRSC